MKFWSFTTQKVLHHNNMHNLYSIILTNSVMFHTFVWSKHYLKRQALWFTRKLSALKSPLILRKSLIRLNRKSFNNFSGYSNECSKRITWKFSKLVVANLELRSYGAKNYCMFYCLSLLRVRHDQLLSDSNFAIYG